MGEVIKGCGKFVGNERSGLGMHTKEKSYEKRGKMNTLFTKYSTYHLYKACAHFWYEKYFVVSLWYCVPKHNVVLLVLI